MSASRLLALVLALAAFPLAAQEPDTPTAPPAVERLVDGRVVRPAEGRDVQPVSGAWVVLHRVALDSAGPLDSVRTRSDGRYAFRFRPFGAEDAIYFVSADYAGIAHFSAPLRGARIVDEEAEITVFDTTSAPVPLTVRGRHFIMSRPGEGGSREVVEVFELSNDGLVTAVSADGVRPTWSVPVPERATDFRVGRGDFAPETMREDGGRVNITTPVSPGLKQVSFAYTLPADAFPVAIPLEYAVDVLEVLIEEPEAGVAGAGLAQVTSVAIEGRNFTRYLAQDAPENAVLSVTAPSTTAAERRRVALIAIGFTLALLMVIVLVMALRRRPAGEGRSPLAMKPGTHVPEVSIATATMSTPGTAGAPAAPPVHPERESDRLARLIAELDAEYERVADEDTKATYVRQRAELKRRLAAALEAQRNST